MILRGAIRAAAAMARVIALTRLLGLRAFSKMTTFDFVMTVALGSLLAGAAQATEAVAFWQALAAMAGPVAMQLAIARVRRLSDRFEDFVPNTPVVLIRDGVIDQTALDATPVARADLIAKLREADMRAVGAVRAVVPETAGDIAVVHGGAIEEGRAGGRDAAVTAPAGGARACRGRQGLTGRGHWRKAGDAWIRRPPMSRIVYVNGDYVPEEEATVSVFDRGFLFADGVYEVTSVIDGKLVDFEGHARRLWRSLGELDMAAPVSEAELLEIHRELVRRNDLEEGLVYLQVTRGAADRDFAYPEAARPTLVLFTQARRVVDSPAAETGIRVISIPDRRWGRRDIKTVQLLYPSMGKMMAKAAGVDDAWMVEDGAVTEGTSNNAYIVTGGKIVTRHLGEEILHGITRAAVLKFAREAQMEVEERPFTVDEAKGADEAFVTSASSFVMPVVEIDGEAVGGGRPGPVARRLREIYLDESRKAAV